MMKTLLKKIFLNKKLAVYGAFLTLSLVLPTSFVFASGGDPGLLANTLTTLMIPFHFLVTAAGTLMGVTLYYTIVRMGYYVHQLSAIQTAWELFRDLGNILIVFGFITIGIATILDNATYGYKKALPKLLIVAVLLNFSLFFAEFVVDAGNVFATQFYASINGGKLPSSASSFSVSKEPIAGSVMTVLKTTGLYKTTDPELSSGKMIELALISIIMFIVMAFVFFAIAIMLISRFVVLLFLFIVSPIGFIGLAGIPLISDYGKKWWHAITNQTIFAPILLLFLLVVTKMIQSNFMQSITGGTAPQALNNPDVTSMANILLSFSVVMGLLFVSLITAKSLSGKAASFAIGQSRKRLAQAFSTPAGAGARLIRGAAQATGDNKFSRGVGHIMRPIERANFDLVGKLGGKQVLGMGESEDTSYRHFMSHGVLGKEGYIRSSITKSMTESTKEMDIERSEGQQKAATKAFEDAQKNKALAQKNKERAEKNKELDPENATGYDKEIEGYNKEIEGADVVIANSMSGLSVKEIAKLDDINKGIGSLVQNLSPERFSMLMKEDSISNGQKAKLQNQRFAPIEQAVASKDASTIREQSTKDLEQYAQHNPKGFASTGKLLSDSQTEQLKKSGSLSTSQVTQLKNNRDARFDTTDGGSLSDDVKNDLRNMNTEALTKLSPKVLSKPGVLKSITQKKIVDILNESKDLSDNTREAFVDHVHKEIREDTERGKIFTNMITADQTLKAKWGL